MSVVRRASFGAGRLSSERGEPRANRLQNEPVRFGGDILQRRRVRKHRAGAFSDVALGRHLRKVQVAQDVSGALLGVGQLSMELRQAAGAEDRRNGAGDALGVKSLRDLGRGAPDDLRSEPAAILQHLRRGRFQAPDQPREGEEVQKIESSIKLPPAKPLADAALEGVVIVMPPFAQGENGEKPVVAQSRRQ